MDSECIRDHVDSVTSSEWRPGRSKLPVDVRHVRTDAPQIFGRRPIMSMSLFLFAAGSVLCGAAQSMTMLIVGRGTPAVLCFACQNTDYTYEL